MRLSICISAVFEESTLTDARASRSTPMTALGGAARRRLLTGLMAHCSARCAPAQYVSWTSHQRSRVPHSTHRLQGTTHTLGKGWADEAGKWWRQNEPLVTHERVCHCDDVDL